MSEGSEAFMLLIWLGLAAVCVHQIFTDAETRSRLLGYAIVIGAIVLLTVMINDCSGGSGIAPHEPRHR